MLQKLKFVIIDQNQMINQTLRRNINVQYVNQGFKDQNMLNVILKVIPQKNHLNVKCQTVVKDLIVKII